MIADPHGGPAPDPPTKPARCLWLTKGLGRGGVERLIVDMLPLVDRSRYQIELGYILPWKNNFHSAAEEAGVVVHCLGSSRSGDPRWIPALRHLLAEGGFDLVHTHAPLLGSAVRLIGPTVGRPAIVHTEHNVWPRYRWPTRYVNAATYHLNNAVIAVSDSVAATIRPPWMAARQPSVATVHHGTVLSSVRSWTAAERAGHRARLGLPAEGFVIGTVANFTPKKDHPNLLRSLAGTGLVADAHLVLIGQGPEEGNLRALVAELGLDDRTTFLGTRDDVFDLLPLFDVFCLSSQFEGFPIALVEAMATGLPCVATSVGGIPEIVEHGVSGLLVPPGDAGHLRAALEQFMSDPALAARCGTGAQAAVEKLDLQHAVDVLLTTYDRLIPPRR